MEKEELLVVPTATFLHTKLPFEQPILLCLNFLVFVFGNLIRVFIFLDSKVTLESCRNEQFL